MPGLLALKLFLVPGLIAGISLAGRRWGAAVAGALAGFPVVTGPILLFVALDRGASFAAEAAVAAINAVLGNIAFGIAYAWVSRTRSWRFGLAAGWIAYFVLIAFFDLLHSSAALAFGLTIGGLLLAPKLYPSGGTDLPQGGVPKSDMPYRMIAGALLVIAVTLLSASLGPSLTGLLSVFPVMGSVLAVFSHRNVGQRFAVTLLRGMVQGFYAFTVFCLILAWGLKTPLGLLSFVAALAAAILLQATLMYLRSRR
jgi:hypothetical protein